MLDPSTDPDYNGKIDPPDAEFPNGRARDALVENDPNATPLLAKKFNDDWGFGAALLADAGLSPSGDPDTALNSQRLQALKLFPKPADSIDFTPHVNQTARISRVVTGDGSVAPVNAPRDANVVVRTLTGLTDCHAFADQSVIDTPSDSGTYGVFDATTKIIGAHAQNHLFAFQDRTEYGGSGSIGAWGNIIWPKHSGTGNVANRTNIEIKDVEVTNGGTVGTNIGIYIRDLSVASSNSAVTSLQSTGYAYYAPNAGAWLMGGAVQINGTATHKGTSLFEGTNYLGGNTKIGGYANGTPPQAGVAATIEKNGLSVQGFIDVNSLGFSCGVFGDKKVQLVSNAITRWSVTDSAGGYAFLPSNLTPDIGSSAFRIGTLFSVNAINTSDEREKQQIRKPTTKEKALAVALKEAVFGYKWNHAVENKGDENARWHFGWIAQHVEKICAEHGFNPFEYGFLCFDEWEDSFEDVQINIGEKVKKIETKERTVFEQDFDIVDEVVKVNSITGEGDDRKVIVAESLQQVRKPKYNFIPVFDEDGNRVVGDDGKPAFMADPIMVEKVVTDTFEYEVDADPIYEKRLVNAAGNRYGINYNDIFAFVLAGI